MKKGWRQGGRRRKGRDRERRKRKSGKGRKERVKIGKVGEEMIGN